MRRVPLLSGSRIVSVPVGEGDVLLRPPPPPSQVVDVAAAVRDALAFPLAGPPLAELVERDARVTIVVEPPALPVPGAQLDPRPTALATALDELDALGIPDERVTLLVAGGLARRAGRQELERLLPPPQARAFRGRVLVHDAAAPDLESLVGETSINPVVADADLVLVVSSAESVVHGGPGALIAACDAATVRRTATARSLVQASGEPAWQLALAVEEAVSARAGLFGVSLVLDHPRLAGRFRGYPHEATSLEHVATSPFRRLYSLLPGAVRRGILRDQNRTLAATA
ncbi:MAG: lactate racemase domain-containing protein, partial [Gaiellaceae bacterium]